MLQEWVWSRMIWNVRKVQICLTIRQVRQLTHFESSWLAENLHRLISVVFDQVPSTKFEQLPEWDGSFFACVCWPVPFAKVSPWKTFRRPTLGCTTIWSPSFCRASHLPTIEKILWSRLDSIWLWKKIPPNVFLSWDITMHHVLVL